MSYDVLVAGSGAAGLVAARAAAEAGASVLLAEAGEAFGGTTALSGGRVWAPCNAHGAAAGKEDSPEAARQYIKAACPSADDALVDAFVATAPEMTAWVEDATPHRFALCPDYPDYLQSLPGATLGGRTLDSAPFDASALGDLVLRGPASVPVTHAEWDRWRFAHRFDEDLLARRDEAGIVTGGRALVAGLLAACQRRRGGVRHRLAAHRPADRGGRGHGPSSGTPPSRRARSSSPPAGSSGTRSCWSARSRFP